MSDLFNTGVIPLVNDYLLLEAAPEWITKAKESQQRILERYR